MHVVFVEPRFPANQQRFVHALASVGARVTGIGESPLGALPEHLRRRLWAYERIDSVVDEEALLRAVRRVQERTWVDRLEATVEAHVLPVARVREQCGIPGTSVRTAHLCRDKPAMKEALRAIGVPTAASAGVETRGAAHEFADRVGYPLVVKPRSAAGAAGTHRVDTDAELDRLLDELGVGRGASVALEEYVEGHEGFFDTLCVDGEIRHHFISHYYPNVLEAMRTRWISPQVVTTNRVEAPGYAEVEALGRRVIEAFEVGTSATHMEWFFGPKGLKFSEIGCRPPGVLVWDLYSAANDIDLYAEWAHAVVHGVVAQQASRRFAAGMIALRPTQDGVVTGYSGIDAVRHRIGEWIIDSHFPPPGSPTRPIEGGYMANAWMRVRHPDYDDLRRILDWIGETIEVYAE